MANDYNRFTLMMDRNQSKPMIIVKDSNGNETSNDPRDKSSEKVKYGVDIFPGLLEQYNLPKTSNYRIVTTFSGANYLYFFGERLPIMTLIAKFTDGTMYIKNKGKDFDYNALYIHKNMDKLLTHHGFSTIFFNRLIIHANILDIETSGSSQTPGTLGAQIMVAVKSYHIRKAPEKENE